MYDQHVSVLCILFAPGKALDSYPSLRKFLQDSDISASKAIQGDVSSTCADPKRWLNPAGQDLLSTLPGFDRYNASMIWGTYRPGVYFGEDAIDTACFVSFTCLCMVKRVELFRQQRPLGGLYHPL